MFRNNFEEIMKNNILVESLENTDLVSVSVMVHYNAGLVQWIDTYSFSSIDPNSRVRLACMVHVTEAVIPQQCFLVSLT